MVVGSVDVSALDDASKYASDVIEPIAVGIGPSSRLEWISRYLASLTQERLPYGWK